MTVKTWNIKAGCRTDVLNTALPHHPKHVLPLGHRGSIHVSIPWTCQMEGVAHDLMEGVADDLTVRQREELAAAVYEHSDVFSNGPTDMG